MPRFAEGLASSFFHKFRYDDSLSRREIDDRERRRVFDCVVKWPPALIKRCPIFREALSEPDEIWDTIEKDG